MIKFILNNTYIETDLPQGMTVLDFVRYNQHLTGTKIGCREGDCGACTVFVGEIVSTLPSVPPTPEGSAEIVSLLPSRAGGEEIVYTSMTACLLPLANVQNKHVVTIEGINQPKDLTPVQHFMVEESGTQCGFCTVGL